MQDPLHLSRESASSSLRGSGASLQSILQALPVGRGAFTSSSSRVVRLIPVYSGGRRSGGLTHPTSPVAFARWELRAFATFPLVGFPHLYGFFDPAASSASTELRVWASPMSSLRSACVRPFHVFTSGPIATSLSVLWRPILMLSPWFPTPFGCGLPSRVRPTMQRPHHCELLHRLDGVPTTS